MCGICATIRLDGAGAADAAELRRMNDALTHRGPDDGGEHLHRHVGLGHRRLSIIDLGTGHQPLSNEDGTVWVVFNGEIYNYRELTRDLEARGHRFATRTDSETLVHLYEEHGADLVDHLQGMFAFVLYDQARDVLVAARDRVGIKPLYYQERDGVLRLASEVKALVAGLGETPTVDRTAIGQFLAFDYLTGERTLFEGVRKLLPGHVLTVERGRVDVRRYWDLDLTPASPAPSFEDARDELRALLDRVVEAHMISDVPVGMLLSGGVDSTAILALAARHASGPISTFTVGFEHPDLPDERPYARLAAERFGTEHHELSVDPGSFTDFLPRYVWHMEDPVCEPPAISLFYVSQLAAEHVKVVLSGEGGDEAFAGYSDYRRNLLLQRARRGLGPLAGAASGVLGAAASLAGRERWAQHAANLARPLEARYFSRTSSPRRTFNRLPEELYTETQLGFVDRGWPARHVGELLAGRAGWSDLSRMLYVDTRSWLVDDLLVKADKITMANSLELRVPILDHQVLEFAARLPDAHKLDGTNAKRILRAALRDEVPEAILTRPKAGFPIPYRHWFATSLQGYLQDVLLDPGAVARDVVRPEAVRRLIREQAEGRDHSKELFCLLVLEWWFRVFVDAPVGAAPAGAR